MDALEIIKQIRSYKKKLEKLNAETVSNDNMMSYGTILSMIIGLYAAYLSYQCNTKKDIPEMSKIIFAVLAYIFGLFYMIYYYLFQYDVCSKL
jgi:uncharacterized protein YacL